MNTPTKMKGGIIFLMIILIIAGCFGIAAFIITLNKTCGEQECNKLTKTGKCSPCELIKTEHGKDKLKRFLKICNKDSTNPVCGKLHPNSNYPESIYYLLKHQDKFKKCFNEIQKIDISEAESFEVPPPSPMPTPMPTPMPMPTPSKKLPECGLVIVLADWCGYCNMFKEIVLEKLMMAGMQEEIEIVLLSDKDTEILEQLGVNGFPYIASVCNGKISQFRNDWKDIEAILNHHKSNMGSGSENGSGSGQNMENMGNNDIEFCLADWCPHCKNMKSEVQKVMAYCQNNGLNCAILDSERDAAKLRQRNVKGFPTILCKGVEYTGPRQAEAIIQFLNKLI